MTITRFAPSPTGYLHVGNVRTALVNFLYSKKLNGKFILRFDDTDEKRSKSEFIDQIKLDMEWLGLFWDQVEFQSKRIARYEEVKQKLIEDGRLYECFETKEELNFKRKMLLQNGLPPIYDRSGLKLSDAEKNKLKSEGKTPHYRFLLKDEPIQWNDDVKGLSKFEGRNLSDPIIFRNDGSMTYILCSVIDDIDFNITNIVRGEDHVSNTAIQMQIFDALNAKSPNFAHLALIKSKDGGISKRDGGFAIKDLKIDGIEAIAINSFLSKIGTSDPIEIKDSLQEIINDFDIKKFGKSQVIYEQREIINLNTRIVASLEFQQVKDKLKKIGLDKVDENFWNSIRNNISQLDDVTKWSEICHKENFYIDLENEEDRNYVCSMVKLLPDNWHVDVFKDWVQLIKEELAKQNINRKGKSMFMPIRKALTGQEDGPELKNIFYLLGKEEISKRLNKKC